MRHLTPLIVLAALVSFFVPSVRAADDMVDNPMYKAWAAQKPGTNVKYTQQMDMGQMKMTHAIVMTLKSVADDKATIDTAIVMSFNGQQHTTNKTGDIPAKVDKAHVNLPPEVNGTVNEAGSEKVTAAGKTFDCKVFEFKGTGQYGNASGKFWRCDDVPGGLVKLEMKVEGQVSGTMNMNLDSIETK